MLGENLGRDKWIMRKPESLFGMAVAESGFGRVCPKCGEKWADRKKFFAETTEVGSKITSVIVHIRRHDRCGGEMFYDKHSEKRKCIDENRVSRDRCER